MGATEKNLSDYESDGLLILSEDKETGEELRVYVSFSTDEKRFKFQFSARASSTAERVSKTVYESVSFFPTAWDPSRTNRKRLYVAGRSVLRPVLERWTFGDCVLSSLGSSSGVEKTRFTPPRIDRVPMPIDRVVQNIQDISVNKFPVGAGDEHVWILEWESKRIYDIDPSTGARSLRSDSATSGRYNSLMLAQHSIYWEVCLMTRTPVNVTRWDHGANPSRTALYDQDLDGVFEGIFQDILNDGSAKDHPLYATGEWIVSYRD